MSDQIRYRAMRDEMEKIAILPLAALAGGIALRALPRAAPAVARGFSRVAGGLFRRGLMSRSGLRNVVKRGKGLRGFAAKKRVGIRRAGTGMEYGSMFMGGGGGGGGRSQQVQQPKYAAAAGKGALLGAALGTGKGVYDIPRDRKKSGKRQAADILMKATGGALGGAALAEAAREAESAGKRVVKGTQDTVRGQIRQEGRKLRKAIQKGKRIKLRWPFNLAHRFVLRK